MNDRELLEQAAKAAGIKCEVIEFGELGVFKGCEVNPEVTVIFNPIYDDGDAFRLMTKLNMLVGVYGSGSATVWYGGGHLTEYGKNLESVARRAIVRAAAEIGRNMK